MVKMFVYILRGISCSSKLIRYYTGMSKRLKERLLEHKNCRSKYTKRYGGNFTIEYIELIEDRSEKETFKRTHKRELQIKQWSQKRKEKLIERNRERTLDLIERYLND